jgi:hypothetical protein
VADQASDGEATRPALLLGRYTIEAVIGEGGLGIVVRAFDTRLKRTVAIKTLKRSLATSDIEYFRILEERFVREAEAGARMGSHPNLVTVHDLVTDGDGTRYLILEYVAGGTVADRLMDGPLPVTDALRITADAARGLQAAHEKGLVHRDVKPANIFLAADGRGQIGDFGIAQIENLSARTHTSAGHPGTPLYMSPEQSRTTGYVRPASDQYSLGLALFEMLTGDAYLRIGKREAERLLATQPERIRILIGRMLADDPDDRYPTMAAVLNAIQAIERTPTVPWSPDRTVPDTSPFIAPDAVADIATRHQTPLLNLQPAPLAPVYPPVYFAPPAAPTGRRRSPWMLPLIALLLIVLLGGATGGALAVKRNHDATVRQNRALAVQQEHYTAGETAFTQEDYQRAVAEFGTAGQYRDAPQRKVDAQAKADQKQAYTDGVAASTKEEYATAVTAFRRAGTYKDAPQQAAQAQAKADQKQAYADGLAALTREEYANAATAFLRAGMYKDAPQQATQAQTLDAQQRQYQAGVDAVGREDFTTAAVAFRAAGTFKDAQQRASDAEKSRDLKASYDAGASAFARGDFKAAKQQFLAAGAYKDAPTRAAQADQEEMLLNLYGSAQGHLKASQWREAYADLQQIQRIRSPYKDVNDIVRHLENDVANPVTIDLYAVLNQGNAYKRGAIPINNLIGKPLAYIVIVSDWSYENLGRPDLVSNVRVYIEKSPDAQFRDNNDVPILSVSDQKKYRDALEKDERLVVITGNGQVIDVQEFGAYHAKLTVTNVATQDRPATSANGFGTDPIFTRLFVDVALSPKTG